MIYTHTYRFLVHKIDFRDKTRNEQKPSKNRKNQVEKRQKRHVSLLTDVKNKPLV